MYKFIVHKNPVTRNSVKVDFKTGIFDIGFFTGNQPEKEDNIWIFVPNNNSSEYQKTRAVELTRRINGHDVTKLTLL